MSPHRTSAQHGLGPSDTGGGTWCGEVELSRPLAAVTTDRDYAQARLLVRLHGEPLGYVQLPVQDRGVAEQAVREAVEASHLERVVAHLAAEGASPVSRLPAQGLAPAGPACPMAVQQDLRVTVVVCTRDRPDGLRQCLARLRALDYPQLEVLVVDNAPTSEATARVVAELAQDRRFRYTREDRPGLSCARNHGLRQSEGDVVAYTDDDVAVDPNWVTGLVRGFQRDETVGCVTGLVCSASLDGPAEAYFDARVSWAASCEPRLYDLGAHARDDGLYPYSPGIFGTGANFAFRRDALEAVGGFDEALGAGSRTGGGEDLDAFVRVLQAGYAIAYEPAAVVWHHHRSDLAALRAQLHSYGTGLAAVIAKHLADPRTRSAVLRRIPQGLRRLASVPRTTTEALPAGLDLPRGLLARELLGMAAGPLLYARAAREVRRAATVPPT